MDYMKEDYFWSLFYILRQLPSSLKHQVVCLLNDLCPPSCLHWCYILLFKFLSSPPHHMSCIPFALEFFKRHSVCLIYFQHHMTCQSLLFMGYKIFENKNQFFHDLKDHVCHIINVYFWMNEWFKHYLA